LEAKAGLRVVPELEEAEALLQGLEAKARLRVVPELEAPLLGLLKWGQSG
jgi:hypothetical protein